MPQNKIQIKLTIILLLTTILISQFFLISLSKTEVYFSFFYNSISPALQKSEDKTININTASPGRTYHHLTNKRTPCPENNPFKSRPGRIQRPARPHPTTRNNQPRMGGMEGTGDNNYS